VNCRPGDLVDLWEGGEVLSGVVLAEEKGRFRIVTERGAEIRIAPSRVAHVSRHGAPVDSPRAGEAATAHAAEARRLAALVDVPSLWELLVDSGERHSIADLAGLAFDAAGGVNGSALYRRLAAEKTWFERHGDEWQARSREAVTETLRRIEVEASRRMRRSAFLDRAGRSLADRASAPPITAEQDDQIFLRKIVDLAVLGDEAPDRREGIALLQDLGASATAPGAFDLLVRLGVFDPDENLDIHRFGLREVFPEEVEAAAREAALAALPEGTRDLTALEAFTLDDEETVEIDDALTWEEGGGGGGVAGIHIADPSAFVRPGDPVDEEAFRRATTYYLPDRRLPMIPGALSEDAASLRPGLVRPALSFLVTVTAEGAVAGCEIVRTRISSRARLTYDQADAILSGAESSSPAGIKAALAALDGLAASLERTRQEAGAILIRAPEVSVKVRPGGGVEITKTDARGPSRRLVAEMMILANGLAAGFCSERKIPAIYRRQPAPESAPVTIPDGPYDPVAVRNLRRSLRRGESSLTPGSHFALGLPAYLQATSPIRRYQDLAVQRQIEAHLAGLPLPYDAEAMARIAATTDEAERAARRTEASAQEYWILKDLASRAGEEVEAVIVAVDPRRTELELTDTLRPGSIAPRPYHVPGKRLRVIVEEARPREGILRLREI